MSAPLITGVTPSAQATDVVLGQVLLVVFDQLIDTTTLNQSTFVLTYPAPSQIVSPNQLITGSVLPSTVSVPGVWSFSVNGSNQTVATFTPAKAFLPNTVYTATVLGADAALSTQSLMNPGRESMAASYQWSFTTGELNLITPPPMSPLVDAAPAIQPAQIKILPRRQVGQDLAQQIVLQFPGPIDPDSFQISDLCMSVEPLLGDPSVPPPVGLNYAVEISGNQILITITGWSQ